MGKFSAYLIKILYGVCFVLLTAILLVVLRHPQNNLIPVRILIYTAVWAGILIGIRAFLACAEGWLLKRNLPVRKLSDISFGICLAVYGVALYFISLQFRSVPVTDYSYVYETALKLGSGQTVEDWIYFAQWTNNLGTLTILSFLMRVGFSLGFSDPYYFVLAVNVLQMVFVLWAVYYLMGKINPKEVSLQWMAVALFLLWTPIWGYTSAFYSDQMSIGGSILGTALFIAACNENGKRRYFIASLGGIVWGIAVFAKITAAIPLVAFVLAVIMRKEKKRPYKEYLIFGALFFTTLFWGGGGTIDILQGHWKNSLKFLSNIGLRWDCKETVLTEII